MHKLTTGSFVVFVALCIGLSVLTARRSRSVTAGVKERPAASAPAPAAPAAAAPVAPNKPAAEAPSNPAPAAPGKPAPAPQK